MSGRPKASLVLTDGVAVIVAVGVNTEGQREALGLEVGASKAEPFWTEFRRSLNA